MEINGGTVVNTVMKFRVPSNVGYVRVEELIIYQELLCSVGFSN